MVKEYNLEQAIDKHLDSQKRNPSNRDYIYVSEIGKTKKAIYESIKLKKPFVADARLKRILENGNKMHERYIQYFIEMGIFVAAEIDVVKEDFLHGRLDCIITDKKQNYVIELKSCSQWTFNKLKKPSKQHNLQVQFYMYYANIPQGFILYENKDNQVIKCFPVKLDKTMVEGYIKELKKLREDIINGVPPSDEITNIENIEYN
ncbi:PD-(D/E)XK nuclease family protein [Candidatus Pacearchaeota archaeon]|nr:PD-(D/E)XK nuclease family protein [Candidatus Pacearchaeota archaeon]